MVVTNLLLLVIVILLLILVGWQKYIYEATIGTETELKKLLFLFRVFDSYVKFKNKDMTYEDMLDSVKEFRED